MRLFVALTLPENIRWQLRMLCGGLAGVRWVPPENFHITLRFLGYLDGGAMEDVDAALAGIRAPAFDLNFSCLGHFASGQRIKSIWAGIERTQALQHLHDKIESAVVRAGLTPDGLKFTPHATLARPRDLDRRKLQDYLAANSPFRTESFPVTHFTLFSSFHGSETAIYRAEQSYALSPQPARAAP